MLQLLSILFCCFKKQSILTLFNFNSYYFSLLKKMTTTYVETDVEGVEGVVDVVDVEDAEDAVDGGLDVRDLVYYTWAVG